MKIDLATLGQQAVESSNGSKKMTLSENASSMVFQLFTKNVYSNPIGTVVREIASNCFDSHVEAGVNKPVIIRKSRDDENDVTYLSFIDFGVGMSPERIEQVYMVYFESTKRINNEQIGGFGIGGKTPLAYKRKTGDGDHEYDNSFFVITTYNGIKYYYCVFEGASSPEVSLLHQEETKEGNGTEIKVPIATKDVSTFEREIKKQLYYFENLIFEGFDDNSFVKNKYTIIRGKNFWYRGGDYSSNVHVCLGRVAYPIDYSALNLSNYDYQLPVAIKLEVGDINVTASRENLDYSETTIKILTQKLEDVKNELIEMVNKKYENITTLKEFYEFKENFGELEFTKDNTINIKSIISVSDISLTNFKYDKFKRLPKTSEALSLFFNMKNYGDRIKSNRWNSSTTISLKGIINNDNFYHFKTPTFQRKVLKQGYLKEIHGTFYIISKLDLNHIPSYDLYNSFGLQKSELFVTDGDKVNTTPMYKLILEFRDELYNIIENNTENYDDVEVSEEFITLRKEKRLKPTDLNKSISARFSTNGWGRGYRYNVTIEQLIKFKGTIVYASTNDEHTLKNAAINYSILFKNNLVDGYSSYYNTFDGGAKKTNTGIMFITIAKGNVKYMKHCRKAYHVSEVYNKLLYRKFDEVKAKYLMSDVYNITCNINQLYTTKMFSLVSKKWYDKAVSIKAEGAYYKQTTDLKTYSEILRSYYPIDDFKHTPEQKKLIDRVNKFEKFQNINANILSYINLPYVYSLDETKTDLINILKKVLVF